MNLATLGLHLTLTRAGPSDSPDYPEVLVRPSHSHWLLVNPGAVKQASAPLLGLGVKIPDPPPELKLSAAQTPVLRSPQVLPVRSTGELGGQRPALRGQTGHFFHLNYHMGGCTLLCLLPCRSPSPGLPWVAGDPQSRAESSGGAGIEDTVCSVTLSTATCGGRQRWAGAGNSLGIVQPWPWGSGGPRSRQSGDLGLKGAQNVITSVTIDHMHRETVIPNAPATQVELRDHGIC